jgi:crotonobetainyl-CoA:carnitine CoA-transferase CaiB-like acyl-CoA transferase
VDTPAGPISAPVPPGLSGGEARMGPVPALGEHTDAILTELGVAPERIAGLRAAKAI